MNLLNQTNLQWKHYEEGNAFDYPINYSDAILDVSADGRLTILVRWEPNCYCHFHRHTAETSSVVLQGELHVTEFDPETGEELNTRVREVGDYVSKGGVHAHMERGGADGALVLFNIFAPDGEGLLAEALDTEGQVIAVSTLKKILERRHRSH